MKNPDPTGYDPEEDRPDNQVEWRVERANRFYSSGRRIVASVIRNDLSIGLLYLRDEEEYEYIKTRITGTQRREPEREAPDA